jgi:uncharacterized protein
MKTVTRFIAEFLIVGLVSGFAGSANAGSLEDAAAAERHDDCATAVPIYRSLAEQGNVQAFKRLGFFSYIGYCAKADWLEAARWYGKAADAGDEGAAGSLGHIGRTWRFMYNTPTDPIIYAMIEKVAKQGSAAAQFSLAAMNYPIGDVTFDQGNGNLSEALIWYRRAADQGVLTLKWLWVWLAPTELACRRIMSRRTNGTMSQRRAQNMEIFARTL